jgi:HSP20 family protein
MPKKESKEMTKPEESRFLPTFEDAEKWFEDAFRRPFSLLSRRRWPQISAAIMEEVMPTVDIFDEGDNLVVKAELPGIKKEDIDISITDHTVKITGEKKREEKVEKKDYYWEERSYGSFTRSFQVPAEVQTDKVKANFKDGVLEIRMPKTPEAKAKEKKVAIT